MANDLSRAEEPGLLCGAANWCCGWVKTFGSWAV